MKPLKIASIIEQVVAHLRAEIDSGSLIGEMPGTKRLADRLGVDHKTIGAALQVLEKQGHVKFQGVGKPRLITKAKSSETPSLRIAILIYQPEDAQLNLIVELRHRLTSAGHVCVLAEKSQMELRWDLKRVERLVKKTEADAWIVQSSTRDILDWFAVQPFPFIALHGRFIGLSVAASGVSMMSAITQAVQRLIELGHRRIVMLGQESDLVPEPGIIYKAFLKQLEAHGIQTSSYNLPRWECTPQGLHQSLDQLFRLTPPTAIFVTDVVLFFPTYLHLLRRGIRIPDEVSLISTEAHSQFNWCEPAIAHCHWDESKVLHRLIEWANKVSNGKEDNVQKFVDAEFCAGETIGPVPNPEQ